ncbi:MAG: hypothetical protein ACOCX2_09060 [Armatimonadota bacterium]
MPDQLRAGVAKVDITPPLGLTMAGYGARTEVADGIEDPLYAYAIALEQGEESCAIVVGDLIGLKREQSEMLRGRVTELCGLPADCVMVCGTPEAWRLREPAVALAGTGDANLVKFNRRPVNPQGNVEMNLRLPLDQALVASRVGAELAETWTEGGPRGERLSDILVEVQGLRVGPAPTHLPVLKLVRPDGSPIAAVMAFGCHPVCGAGREETFYRYSADWPGYARRVIERMLGCPALLLLGSAGDQVPLRRGGDSRRRIGHSVGAEALRVWELIEGDGAGPLRVSSRTVDLPLRELPSVEEARAALEATDDPEGTGAVHERHMLQMAEKHQGQQSMPVEVWSMALGDEWGLVGLPGEVLSEFELQIRQQSPFAHTAVIELSLDSPGYLPTDAAIDEGGYETGWSPFGRGVEAAAVEGAVEALTAVGPGRREG